MTPETFGNAYDFGDFLVGSVGKVGYLIGTRGELCTPQLIARMRAAYPTYAAKIDLCASKWLGKTVADCYGWLEQFYNGGDWDKPLSTFKYPDARTYEDYALAKLAGLPNGPMSTIPRNLPYPIAVGYVGHIGYFHRGVVYQSAGHCSGTIITAIDHVVSGLKAWEYWYQMPRLSTVKKGDNIMYQYGDSGDDVRAWQASLVRYGIPLPKSTDPVTGILDGKFGPEVKNATIRFQTEQGLPANGTGDDVTVGKMMDILRAREDKVKSDLDAANATVASLTDEVAKQNAALAIKDQTIAKQDAEIDGVRANLNGLEAFRVGQ